MSYLFITHNIGVVEYIADEVAVMRAGRFVEEGPATRVLQAPQSTSTPDAARRGAAHYLARSRGVAIRRRHDCPWAQTLLPVSCMEYTVTLCAMLGLVRRTALAQADRFRAIDRNGDGSISSEEWYAQGVRPYRSQVVDLDGDGRISDSEFREWSAARGGTRTVGITPADRFRTIDKNKDGVISAEEWKDGSLSRTPFATVDANKDGTISRSEFITWDQERGGPAVGTPAQAPGSAAPTLSERMRSPSITAPPAFPDLPASRGLRACNPLTPPAASSRTPAPPSPVHDHAEHERHPGRKLAEHEQRQRPDEVAALLSD
jgi:Ca2+-binding EF-hand superfamily protein